MESLFQIKFSVLYQKILTVMAQYNRRYCFFKEHDVRDLLFYFNYFKCIAFYNYSPFFKNLLSMNRSLVGKVFAID